MIDKEKYLITYIIIGYFISLCLSQSTPKPLSIDQCSKWNISEKRIIFGRENGTAGDDDSSLNLTNSNLGINTETGEIAILDDNNHRILVMNQSNTSTLFAILSESSNLTNSLMIQFSPSAITYDFNNSIYILDGWNNQIAKMKNPLEYGENATLINETISLFSSQPFSGVSQGLCVDNINITVFISDYNHSQIIFYDRTMTSFRFSIYIGSSGVGNANNRLRNPTSIVIDNNRTLYVNDFGNNRIQMFKYNSTIGTTLPTNIRDCIGLSLYSPDILVMNTKTAVYLFNLTNNETTCVIGCNYPELNDTHNAIIDNNGNLIITDSNQILSYSIYQQCPDVTTEPTTVVTTKSTVVVTIGPTTAPSAFSPINNCPNETFGVNCASSNNICDLTKPCLNSGICIENKTISYGYTCECAWGFKGNNCEDDQRPCKPFTCFGRGVCANKTNSSTAFECHCDPGYEGEQCEKTVNFCQNVTCQNRGVCSQQFLNYTCNCLTGTNGRHCEIIETSAVVRTYVIKSFGYVAILMLFLVIGFIVIMDVLKYVFGIDPVQSDRDNLKKKGTKNLAKKNKIQKPRVVYRFQYVN